MATSLKAKGSIDEGHPLALDWAHNLAPPDEDPVQLQIEISRLQAKSQSLTKSIFSKLDAWQISQLARHPQRPYALDYIQRIFTEFEELHGDRTFADDPAIVGGPARLDGKPVMVIGQQKGRDTKEKIYRNFGMPHLALRYALAADVAAAGAGCHRLRSSRE